MVFPLLQWSFTMPVWSQSLYRDAYKLCVYDRRPVDMWDLHPGLSQHESRSSCVWDGGKRRPGRHLKELGGAALSCRCCPGKLSSPQPPLSDLWARASPVTQCGTEVAFSDAGDGDDVDGDGAKLMWKASLPFKFSFLLPLLLLIIPSFSCLFSSKLLPFNIFQV